MATVNPRLAVNLLPAERAMLDKAKAAFERRTGATIPVTEVIRLAIKAFAKQEKVR